MKIGLQFDEDGNYVGDYLEGKPLPDNHTVIPTHLAEGKFTYLPKLVDGEVAEGLSQEEIDAIVNAPAPVQPVETLGKQIVALELRLLQLEGR